MLKKDKNPNPKMDMIDLESQQMLERNPPYRYNFGRGGAGYRNYNRLRRYQNYWKAIKAAAQAAASAYSYIPESGKKRKTKADIPEVVGRSFVKKSARKVKRKNTRTAKMPFRRSYRKRVLRRKRKRYGGRRRRRYKRRRYVRKAVNPNPLNIHKHLNSGAISCAENSYKMQFFAQNSTTFIEAACASNIKYLDQNAGATATSVQSIDLTTNGISEVGMKLEYSVCKFVFKNNTNAEMHVNLLEYRCTDNTSTTPLSLMAEGINNLLGTSYAGDGTDDFAINHYASDSRLIKADWKRLRTTKKFLRPGEQFKYSLIDRNINYNPNIHDAASFDYPKRFKHLLVKVQGAVAHDATTTTLVGTASTQLDWICESVLTYRLGQRNKQVFYNTTGSPGLDTLASANVADVDGTSIEVVEL